MVISLYFYTKKESSKRVMGKVNFTSIYGEVKEYVVDHKKFVLIVSLAIIALMLMAMFGLWYES